MNSDKVLILGLDKKRVNLLSSLLKEVEAEVFTVDNVQDAENLLSSSELTLILLEYNAIVNEERDKLKDLFKAARKTKLVISDVPEDAARRLAFYRLGAYRILGINYEVEDIYYLGKNLLNNGKPSVEQKESRFSGRLQDFSLPALINNFGKEKRSGILRIQTQVSSGKIYFNKGHIYQASAGYLKDDDAVLYIMTWNNGQFSMSPLPEKKVNNRMHLSNVGLLLQSESVRDHFYKLVRDLGGFSIEMRLINRGDLSHKERDPEFKNFLEKLTDFRQIIDIIQNSPYPMIETLNTIIALKGSNNLEIRESGQVFDKRFGEQPQESSGLIEKLLSVEEVSQFRKSLNATEIGSGKLLILGGKTCGKTDFIRQFNQGSVSGVKSDQELDFTTIELAINFNLQVFGIALEEKLSKIVETLSEGLVGYIFLIDSKQTQELEYTNYVINNLISKHEVPCAIAVTNLGKQANKIPQKIKSAIHLSNRTTLMACDVTNKDDVRKVLMSLAPLK